jgi:hypothetical protein
LRCIKKYNINNHYIIILIIKVDYIIFTYIYIMPCSICKNNSARTYTHSRTSQHRKLLFKKMKDLKARSVDKYGVYIWKEDDNILKK